MSEIRTSADIEQNHARRRARLQEDLRASGGDVWLALYRRRLADNPNSSPPKRPSDYCELRVKS